MQAEYVMRVQAIRSQKQAPRFYVNIPLPLAAALDLVAGEQVQWQLLGRSDLRLRRLAAPASLSVPRQIVSKWRKRFFEERRAGLDDQPRTGCPLLFPPRSRRAGQGAGL